MIDLKDLEDGELHIIESSIPKFNFGIMSFNSKNFRFESLDGSFIEYKALVEMLNNKLMDVTITSGKISLMRAITKLIKK